MIDPTDDSGRWPDQLDNASRGGTMSGESGPQTPGSTTLLPFPVVGIGASAGGLKALISLLSELPSDIGMAFVVIQHLDPSHESQLPTLLAKNCRLSIEAAKDGTAILPNHVYVITPSTRIVMERGILHTTPSDLGPGRHLSIDAFLRSIAMDRPGRAIGVILSGTGSDGTFGLAAIKAAGGLTFAQDDSAEYPGMPVSAIGQGHVDFILRPQEIAQELARITQFGFPTLLSPWNETSSAEEAEAAVSSTGTVDQEAYAAIIALLRTATGVDFTHYRSATIIRRTMRRMTLISRTTLGDYARYLADVPGEVDALARDILINVTSFFRDRPAYKALRSLVMPTLVDHRHLDSPIRVWVVGCSTGQEVYSLAIEFLEFLKDTSLHQPLQIFATDISDWALVRARAARYPEGISEEIAPERLARYFTRDGTGYQVTKEVRDLCVFAKHDITADIPFSRIDLISCRNVLIYLGPVLQEYVLPTFHFSLKHGGFLLLGASESLGRASSLYQTVDERNRLYRSIIGTGRVRPLPISRRRSDAPGMLPPSSQLAQPVPELKRAADRLILGRFCPASVLITETMDIIQFRGRTNPYLEPAQGEVSLNLLTMVPFGVAEALREAVLEVKKQNRPVRRERIAYCREQVSRLIAFEVIPITVSINVTGLLVIFEEQPQGVSPDSTPPIQMVAGPPGRDPDAGELSQLRIEVVQLRYELAAATSYTQSIVEMSLEHVEALKEVQEEAQSSSEEYRSTNEELQTAKEEVESTNELWWRPMKSCVSRMRDSPRCQC